MNKPRLIDANALLDRLPYPTDYAESEFYGKILDVIDEIPTAYDLNAVVGRLKGLMTLNDEYISRSTDPAFKNDLECQNKGIYQAVKIIERGVE